MSSYPDLELVSAFEAIPPSVDEIRIYRTSISKSEAQYRYHLGFPKRLVTPLLRVLESSVGWGVAHWTEKDGFLLWATEIIASDLPVQRLQKEKVRLGRVYRKLVSRTKIFAGI